MNLNRPWINKIISTLPASFKFLVRLKKTLSSICIAQYGLDMKTNRVLPAKIVSHTEGLGVPNTDLVRQRAKEIAMINGRGIYNDADWRQAKLELHGSATPCGEDGDEMQESFSERDMIPGSLGRHTENSALEDAGNVIEELVSEGMDEAVHDQMLQASKMEDRRE
jgi:hypothetical protein